MAIILGAVALYMLDRVPIEAVSLGALSLLLVLFGAFPYQADNGSAVTIEALLSGFSSPALITVLALLIVGKGLFATDALEGVTNRIGRLYGGNPRLSIAIILVVAGVTSAFLNNTPVVVIFIPVLTSLAARFRLPAYQIFMPLSFITILGGMTTLIGSSTNMIAAGMAEKQGVEIGFFGHHRHGCDPCGYRLCLRPFGAAVHSVEQKFGKCHRHAKARARNFSVKSLFCRQASLSMTSRAPAFSRILHRSRCRR